MPWPHDERFHSKSFFVCSLFVFFVQKKERECKQLRIAVLCSELQRQKKALGREIDVRQKERAHLQKKGKSNWRRPNPHYSQFSVKMKNKVTGAVMQKI